MIHPRARFRCPIRLAPIAVVLLVATGCGGDDAAEDGPATTAISTSTFADTPSSEWGELADCPIEPQTPEPGGAPADEGVEGVLDFGVQVQEHVDGCVESAIHPAVGGEHFEQWANCGFYPAPVPEEVAVHVLEHGGVWVVFDPTIGADEIATIRAAADDATHLLASPDPALRSKVVLTAWSRQLSLDSTTDPRFDEFIETYLQGPTTPEPGAPCDGGIGTPT